MIYLLIGDDTKNKNIYIKELTKDYDVFFVKEEKMDRELLISYCYNVNLFNKLPAIVVDNILSDDGVSLKTEDLEFLKNSRTLFLLKEDKLLKSIQDKYKKYGEVKLFEQNKLQTKEKFNVFSITDAFARKDKIGTWVLYMEALKNGVEPEAIAGVLFWKIKTILMISKNKDETKNLKQQSSEIISLYHKAHKGERDLSIGLEQFILSSLSFK